MESDSGSRGVLVRVAGFFLGSLGLFLSILTAAVHHFLGRDTLVALTRTLDHSDAERQELHRRPHSRHPKPSQATSPIPSISVTLHQTGNSIAHSVHSTNLLLGQPRPSPPPRRPTVIFAPAPAQPRPPSRRSSPALKDPQWLSLPPIQTRSSSGKGGRRHTLNRARSSPQLTSFAAAGVSFSSVLTATTAGPPCDAQSQSFEKEQDLAGKCVEGTGKEKVEEWQSIYLSEEGSPTTTTATVTVPSSGSDSTSSLAPEASTKSHTRPTLRKAKTLGDLLRRVPSGPGPPPLPISPQKLESTTKKAFAFTNTPKPKSKSSKANSSSDPEKEPRFILSMKSPRHRSKSPDHDDRCRPRKSKSKEKSKERKRTQPYEAPYFWTPPDQAAAMGITQQTSIDSGTPRGRKAGGPINPEEESGTARKGVLKSAPVSRAVSPARVGEAA